MGDVTIRAMRVEDSADWHELRTRPSVIWGTMQLPTLSLEDVRTQAAAAPNVHKLVAELDGKVVGSINLQVGSGPHRHCGYIGMSVHDDYQGQGLGKRLMATALDLADRDLMLERTELGVYPDNDRAIHLYRSFGFETEGLSPATALRDGSYVGVLHMGRLRGRAASGTAEAPPPSEAVAKSYHPSGLQIRPARPEDFRAIYGLHVHPALRGSLGRLPSMQEDEFRKEVCPPPRGHHMIVAQVGGDVVGVAWFNGFAGRRVHSGQINSVAVVPEWQGRGIGTALLQALLDLADRWLGLKRLEAVVQAPDAAARALFQHCGFQTEALHRAAAVREGRFVDTHRMGRVTGL